MAESPAFEDFYLMLLNREKRLEVYHTTSGSTAVFTKATRAHAHGHYSRGGSQNSTLSVHTTLNWVVQVGKTEDLILKDSVHIQVLETVVIQSSLVRFTVNLLMVPSSVVSTIITFINLMISLQVFSAMNSPTKIDDSTWFANMGAANHMTANASSMTNCQEYNGSEQITLANGNTLPISH